jgi:hypothetical protein
MLKPVRFSAAFFASCMSSYTTKAVPFVFAVLPLHKVDELVTVPATSGKTCGTYLVRDVGKKRRNIHSYLTNASELSKDIIQLFGRNPV